MDEVISIFLKINKDKALEIIYKKYYAKVKSLCYKLLYNKNEAEDVTQDVFIKIIEKIDTFSFRSSIGTWIYRIAINHIFNINKKLNFHLEFSDDILQNLAYIETDVAIDLKKIEIEIGRALEKLKDDEKKVFILREYEGLSYKDISKILDMNEGTVKSKLFYIRIKLQEALKKTYEEIL